MDVVDLAERCCFVLHSFVFFFIFLPGRLWMCKWQGVGPCSAVYPSPFHTHTRAAELLYIVDYVMDFFFGFCFPRSTFLFFKFFARLNFFYNSPIDRYHTHALCTLWPPGQWTHPAGLVNIIILFFFAKWNISRLVDLICIIGRDTPIFSTKKGKKEKELITLENVWYIVRVVLLSSYP
jgi:hypothetical protein